METANFVNRIGGDWTELVPAELDGLTVDVYRTQGKNCDIDVAVFKGIVYLRAKSGDDIWANEYELFTEDDAVIGALQTLRTTGLVVSDESF